MSSKPTKKHPGRRGDPVSLALLTIDEAVDAIFQISPKDVKRIVASRPGKKPKGKLGFADASLAVQHRIGGVAGAVRGSAG